MSVTEHVDFIDLESTSIDEALGGLQVACRALASTSEGDDGIGGADLKAALRGLVHQLETVRVKAQAVRAAADKLYDEARRQSAVDRQLVIDAAARFETSHARRG